jgi:hypothetical protein
LTFLASIVEKKLSKRMSLVLVLIEGREANEINM